MSRKRSASVVLSIKQIVFNELKIKMPKNSPFQRQQKPIYRAKIGCYIRLAKQNRGQTASKLRAWCRRVVFPTGVPLLRSQVCLRTEKRGSARPSAAKPFYGVAVAQGTFRVRLAPTRNPEPGAGSSKGMFRHFIKEETP